MLRQESPTSAAQGLFDDQRVALHQRQQHSSGSCGGAVALLPVAQGSKRDANPACKRRLRQAGSPADRRHVEPSRHRPRRDRKRSRTQGRGVCRLGSRERIAQPAQQPIVLVFRSQGVCPFILAAVRR